MSGSSGEAEDSQASFDVFIAHNAKDLTEIEEIALRLRQSGLKPWLAPWEQIAGRRFQHALARGIANSRCVAVLVGRHGMGDWQLEEVDKAVERAVPDSEFRVFLVLLPGLPESFKPRRETPFLSTRHWVDLRAGWDSDAKFRELDHGIRGLPAGPPETGVPGKPRVDASGTGFPKTRARSSKVPQPPRRRRHVLVAMLMGLVVLLLTAIGLQQLRAAHLAQNQASSRELAGTAQAELGADPWRSLRIAVEAERHAHTPEAEQAMRAGLAHSTEALALTTGGELERATFSSDGSRLLVIARNRPVQLWGTRSGRRLAVPRQVDAASSAGFSPSGRLVAAGGWNQGWIWTAGGRLQSTLDSGGSENISVSDDPFSADERRAATGGAIGVTIWKTATGRRERLLRSRQVNVTDARFDPRDRYVAATSTPLRATRIVRRSSEIWSLEGTNHLLLPGSDPLFSPDGRRLATVSDQAIFLWALPSGRRILKLPAPSGRATFSEDGGLLLTSGAPTGRAYATSDGQPVARLPRRLQLVARPAFGPDGRFALAGDLLYSPLNGLPIAHSSSYPEPGASALPPMLAPDGNVVLTQVEDRLRLARLPDWSSVVIPGQAAAARQGTAERFPVSFAIDRHRWTAVLLKASSGTFEVWRGALPGPAPVGPPIRVAEVDAAGLTLNRNGRLAASIGTNGISTLWTTSSWKAIAHIDVGDFLSVNDGYPTLRGGVPLALSDEGHRLGLLSKRKTGVWATSSGKRLGRLAGAGGDLVLDQAGSLALSTSPPRLWKARTGQLVARLQGISSAVGGALSPDGRFAATFDGENVQVWATDSGERVSTISTPGAVSADFSHDDRLLLIASAIDGVSLWQSETGELIGKLLERPAESAIASFTDDERAVAILGGDAVQVLHCDACRHFDEVTRIAERRASLGR